MSAPVLLPGDWVWISFGYTVTAHMSRQEHLDTVVAEGREMIRKFNQMGVYVLGYSGNPQKVGMSVDAVFRNGITLGPDGQPGPLPFQTTS